MQYRRGHDSVEVEQADDQSGADEGQLGRGEQVANDDQRQQLQGLVLVLPIGCYRGIVRHIGCIQVFRMTNLCFKILFQKFYLKSNSCLITNKYI